MAESSYSTTKIIYEIASLPFKSSIKETHSTLRNLGWAKQHEWRKEPQRGSNTLLNVFRRSKNVFSVLKLFDFHFMIDGQSASSSGSSSQYFLWGINQWRSCLQLIYINSLSLFYTISHTYSLSFSLSLSLSRILRYCVYFVFFLTSMTPFSYFFVLLQWLPFSLYLALSIYLSYEYLLIFILSLTYFIHMNMRTFLLLLKALIGSEHSSVFTTKICSSHLIDEHFCFSANWFGMRK